MAIELNMSLRNFFEFYQVVIVGPKVLLLGDCVHQVVLREKQSFGDYGLDIGSTF
jgi:hypothetical protein